MRPTSLPSSSTMRQPLPLVLAKQAGRLLAVDALVAGDQRHRRHDVADEARAPLGDRDEAQVAVGDDAEQRAVLVDDRQAGDAVLAADLVELLEGGLRADRDRVGDHPGLGPLHQVHLVGLVLDRQVAVQHPDAALAGHRDRHPRLGDGVHGAGHQRHPERRSRGSAGWWCPPRSARRRSRRGAAARRRRSARASRTWRGHPARDCRGECRSSGPSGTGGDETSSYRSAPRGPGMGKRGQARVARRCPGWTHVHHGKRSPARSPSTPSPGSSSS